MSTLLFVYGTLKRGCSNHHHLAGQTFAGPARTLPGYRLRDLGGYPGLVVQTDDRDGIVGEVWAVDDEKLRELDRFEGVHEGLYRRETIQLQPPFADRPIQVYVPGISPSGGREIGSEWVEP